MPTVQCIADYLDTKAPAALKMDFDNVGLLCGFPEREVHTVLVVLDITADAVREAKEAGAELIVSHHPVIFTPMKHILSGDTDGERVIQLIQNGISAICLHTNLDIVAGGVNSALAQRIGAKELSPLSECGCVAELSETEDTDSFACRVKTALTAEGLRYSAGSRSVHRIGICGGAGGDILFEAKAHGCDTVLTGEIKHHEWIAGQELGLNMIDAGHFATENVIIPILKDWLETRYPELKVLLSARQKNFYRGL